MRQEIQFRKVLPIAQTILALLFAGLGLWQRNQILSHSWFGWNSTARFHVWPWPFKYAVVSNTPAFLAGMLLSWPVDSLWPRLPEPIQISLALPFIPILWYWVGSRLDRKWGAVEGTRISRRRSRWVFILIFTLVCMMGAYLPSRYLGYVGYLYYGIVVWVATPLILHRFSTIRPDGSLIN
ncbi:MAG: hypothetical protein LAO21_11530 [Acidobacteriia bacterium]|nr:hypothetical protein [Terriglobia bacterium]